jgi:hypothetical protein
MQKEALRQPRLKRHTLLLTKLLTRIRADLPTDRLSVGASAVLQPLKRQAQEGLGTALASPRNLEQSCNEIEART